MEEVAISLSGGGFRAAMFHLGTVVLSQSFEVARRSSGLAVIKSPDRDIEFRQSGFIYRLLCVPCST